MEKSWDISALLASASRGKLLADWDVRSLCGTIAVVLATYLIIGAMYNIYLHPLRRFPGPISHKISKLPQFFVRVTGTDPFFHLAQHQRYGDVVRVGPDALSFAHPDAWRDIYARAYDAPGAAAAAGSNATRGRKGIARHERMYTPWRAEKSVFNASGALHARQRRVLAPAFSERACREYEPVLMKYVGQLVGRLKGGATSGGGAVFDMADMYQSATLDIMADIAGREPTRFLQESKVHGGWRLEVEQKLYHLMMSLRTFPWWTTWLFVRLIILPIYTLAVEDQKFDAEATDSRWAEKSRGVANGNTGHEKVEMWKFAQKSEDGSIAMPADELDANVQLLMFAGAETTANLVTGTTNFLIRNPEKLERLREVLRSTFGSSEEMTMTNLIAVDYLNACLKEGLRLHPPTPSNMLRKVPLEGAQICNYHIPGGTEVSASPYAMDHLEKYWRDPWRYEPERWTGGEQFEQDARETFQPFSTGPQNCLGMALAWHEARLLLANVIHAFEITLDKPQNNWTDARGLVVWEKKPLLVRVVPRQSP